MNKKSFFCCCFLICTACTSSPVRPNAVDASLEDTSLLVEEVIPDIPAENYYINEIAIRTIGEDGQIKNFDGEGSWNYLDDFVVQVQVKSESGDSYHANRKIELTLYSNLNEKIWSDTKDVSYLPEGGKYASWIISDSTLNCNGQFKVEATLNGQTPTNTASISHNAQCGE